jgi:3-phosphoshikimate 1-carboxyvinyltransferase
MGATIEGDRPPITIHGGNLKPIDFVSPVASAQVKSCVLLAGLFTDGITSVTEPSMSRNHTETMLARMGVHLNCINTKVSVEGGQRPRGFEMSIPADISSASFFIVAATLLDGPGLLIREMLINPTRTGVIDVLDQIGATYEIGNVREEMGEAVGDLFISANGRKPFIIEGDLVPRLIDEIPVLAVLATQLEGRSIIRNANEVRVKESDRLAVMAGGLSRMGAKVELLEDGLVIDGPTPLVGVEIDACLDHRIAMSFAIAGLLAEGTTKISGAESIATSFPGFVEELRRLTNV